MNDKNYGQYLELGFKDTVQSHVYIKVLMILFKNKF
jgi:hypothetical protein